MNEKLRIVLLSVIAFLILSLTTTYGLWYVTRNQTNSNVIATKCLDISLTSEQNDINLTEAYPMTDEEGMKLTPFTFNIKNNCSTITDYQLNLELLGNSDSVSASAIKVSLNDNTSLLSNKETRKTTIEGAYTSYQLMYGRLEANESEDYRLRLWVDENASVSESNKVFESKIVVVAGQGIENPFEEGTIAHSIVGNAGGLGNITELSTEWSEDEWGDEKEVAFWSSNTNYWGTDYEFDKTDGTYALSGNIVRATIAECREIEGLCGQYYNPTIGGSRGITKINSIYPANMDNGNYVYVKAQKKSSFSNFMNITATSYAKLHKTEDDLGIRYYFRGNIDNNYVKFGKWAETDTSGKAGKDMYWRIIRVNGDETVRMIYDGTEAVSNGTEHTATIGTTAYNTNYDNAKYVGYTYENEDGTQTDSTIKSVLDTWYDTNLKTNYGRYIADSIFCNDRTSSVSGVNIYYGAYAGLYLNNKPQLKCSHQTDKYTINAEYGNGYLTNPVGLITADEVAMAGGVALTPNNTYYLSNSNAWYWTSTPYSYSNWRAGVCSVSSSGNMTTDRVNSSDGGVRPVISLKADVEFTGEGTIDNPYEIITK